MTNKNLKKRFLEQYPESTRQNMEYVLFADIVKIMEEKKGKDLYEFNRDELLKLIGELNPSSYQAAATRLSFIRKYIKFAMINGYLTTGINFANLITPDNLKDVVNAYIIKLKYLTKEELKEIADGFDNAIDAVFVMLLYEGVKGESLSEIVNLRKKDIDFENRIIKLTDKNNTIRYKKISQETINMINEALEQDKYFVVVENRSLRFSRPMPSTDYVIRTVGNYVGPAKSRTLIARLRAAKKKIGNPYITPTSIWESGMINYAKKLKEKEGIKELTTDHYKEISKWAGRSEILWHNTKMLVLPYI